MSVEDFHTTDEVVSSTESTASPISPTSSLLSSTASSSSTPAPVQNNKRRRAQKQLKWRSSLDNETYRTIVVNYQYPKFMRKLRNNLGRTTTTTSTLTDPAASAVKSDKQRWNQILTNLKRNTFDTNDDVQANSNDGAKEEEDFIPNLRKLYELSNDNLSTAAGATTSTTTTNTGTIVEQSSPEVKQTKAEQLDDIKLEIYFEPREYEATVVEPQYKTEIIVISDDDDEDDGIANAKPNDVENKSNTNNKQQQQQQQQHNDIPEVVQNNFCSILRQLSMSNSLDNVLRKTDTSSQLRLKTLSQSTQQSQPPAKSSTLKQRQMELHRHRVAVEAKRLELLELKLTRERDEMLHNKILFEKELQIKLQQIDQFIESLSKI